MKDTYLKIEIGTMPEGRACGDCFQQPRRQEVAEADYRDVLAAVLETVSARPASRRIKISARTDFEIGPIAVRSRGGVQ